MRYLSLFSGIGTGEKGIEQSFFHYQQQSPDSGKAEHQAGSIGRERDTDERGHGVHASDESALCDRNENQHNKPERLSGGSNCNNRRDMSHAISPGRQQQRGQSTCIGFSEIDTYAEAIYRYHYPGHKNYGDATAINVRDLPDFDFLIGGFPCQAFSIAGKRKGFDDTRGTLFFEIARILRGQQPSHFLLENVKGLLSHNDGNTFATIISALDEIGYDLEWTVCNSKHFGVPQNRERVFIIGHLRGVCGRKVLPIGDGYEETDPQLRDVGHSGTGGERGRIFHPSGVGSALSATDYKQAQQIIVRPVLTPDRPEPRQSGRRFKENGEEAFTLTAQDQHGVMIRQLNNPTHSNNRVYAPDGASPTLNTAQGGNRQPFIALDHARIRRLTPTECERLQGLEDGWTKYGRFGDEVREISDTRRYAGLGNAFTVNVIEWLMTQLIEGGCVE